jgi:oxygen-independent coproporphyrinogen-3 oxidase
VSQLSPEKKPWGLYVHVPFCRRKCRYCDFYSIASRSLIPAYLDAVDREARFYVDALGSVSTLYVGGGTPSLLDPAQLRVLFDALHDAFDIAPSAEITLEVNPESLDQSYLGQIRRLGVNRLSLGVQSLDDRVLEFLGRSHRVSHVKDAVTWARGEGFDNLNLDLIYGVPGQDLSAWREVLLRVLDFNPEHLSLYQLTFEPGTPLGLKQKQGLVCEYEEEDQRDFFLETARIIQRAGFFHYEVSNFARHEVYISQHNLKYWQHQPYLGLGPAAHSFDGTWRWWNHASVKRYIKDVQEACKPVAGSETLDGDALQLEALYFGFRTAMGLDLETFLGCYGLNLMAHPDGLLQRLENLGWVKLREGKMMPTLEGMIRADALPLLWQ